MSQTAYKFACMELVVADEGKETESAFSLSSVILRFHQMLLLVRLRNR